MNSLDLSVIIPVYERTDFLGKTLDSVFEIQSFSMEIIIVNDGSSSEASNRIEQIAQNYSSTRILVLDTNRGVSYARNIGLRNAHGEFVMFLDADDLIQPKGTIKAIGEMQTHPDTDILIGKSRLFSDDATSPAFLHTKRYFEWLQKVYHHKSLGHPAYFLIYCPPIHAMLFRRSSLKNVQFPEDIHYGEDRWLMLSLKNMKRKFLISDLQLADYRYIRKSNLEDRFHWINKLATTKLIRDGFQKGYLLLLLSYFYFSKGSIGKSLKYFIMAVIRSPTVLIHAFRAYFKL